MGTFENYNPLAVTVYFLSVSGIAMFSMNPFILLLSFFGTLLFYFVKNRLKNVKTHLFSLVLFLVMALINPLVSHNGKTVLFVMNNNPVTLESLVYGIFASLMIISVLYWFRSFSQIMTSDKLLYIFGSFSPKIALILSMALRYVSLFSRQLKKVNHTQKAMGLYKEDNIIDSFRGGLRVFSIMITWALENGIITADSMSARGYGTGRRSRFSDFRFRKGDVLLLFVSLLLCAVTVTGLWNFEFAYYPLVEMSEFTPAAGIGFAAYGILTLLPVIIEVKEALKWKYLTSKI